MPELGHGYIDADIISNSLTNILFFAVGLQAALYIIYAMLVAGNFRAVILVGIIISVLAVIILKFFIL